MKEIKYTLITDGSSDQALMPILYWLLKQHLPQFAFIPRWADLSRLRRPPKGLPNRIITSLTLFPCDILFIHRDAERDSYSLRKQQIDIDVAKVKDNSDFNNFTSISVIPIRMQEAWLLFDEDAIRHASGNPNSAIPLKLPRITDIENEPDPKEILYSLLAEASDLHGRRRKQFPVSARARRVAEYIDDFSPLRSLSAFNALEDDITDILTKKGWL